MAFNTVLDRIIDRLIRRVWFDDLASRSQAAFDEYLQRRGLDPATVTEGNYSVTRLNLDSDAD